MTSPPASPAATPSLPSRAFAVAPLIVTALAFAGYAAVPRLYPEDFAWWGTMILLAELPLCLLGAVFAATATLVASPAQRIGIYGAAVIALVVGSGLWELFQDDVLGPVLAWGIIAHITTLLGLGEDPGLAGARADAMAEDEATLVVLTGWGVALAAIGILAIESHRGMQEQAPWHLLAAVAAGHFAVRAWSCLHACGAGFAATRRRLLDRPWIEWLVRNLGRSDSRHDTHADLARRHARRHRGIRRLDGRTRDHGAGGDGR